MDVLEGKCEQGHWLDDIVLAFVLGVERMRNSDRRLWIVGMALAAVVVLSKWELVGIAVLLILLAILVVSVVAERELLKVAYCMCSLSLFVVLDRVTDSSTPSLHPSSAQRCPVSLRYAWPRKDLTPL